MERWGVRNATASPLDSVAVDFISTITTILQTIETSPFTGVLTNPTVAALGGTITWFDVYYSCSTAPALNT
jgi:predicted TIM-barrel enzyme